MGSGHPWCSYPTGTNWHAQRSLIHMYYSLDLVSHAHFIYREIIYPDLVTVTFTLTALAVSGEVDSAKEMFDKMPDRDTVS
jgi:pentatricopeptide repeat protein